MKAQLIRDMPCTPCAAHPTGIKPSGTVLEDHRAFRLVQMGVAIPADEECAGRCGMSEEDMAKAQAAYVKVAKGIHPDDYEEYDAGLFDHYDEHGRKVDAAGRVVERPQVSPVSDD